MKVRPAEPGAALERALQPLVGRHAERRWHTYTPWHSPTFNGTRHGVKYRFRGRAEVDNGERFIAGLDEETLTVRGHLVASAAVVAVAQAAELLDVTIEALLLEVA